jgi:transposase
MKHYTKEFKLGAVRLVLEEKKSVSSVARDLGVAPGSITKWIKDYEESGEGAFPGKGHLRPDDERIRQLEKEVRQLRMERDLLKKPWVYLLEQRPEILCNKSSE